MLEKFTEIEWRMRAGAVLSLDDPGGCEIVCLEGLLWLTEAGGGADIWLRPGQRHRLRRTGRAVLEAVGGSRVGLRRPAVASRWHRLAAALAGRAAVARPEISPA